MAQRRSSAGLKNRSDDAADATSRAPGRRRSGQRSTAYGALADKLRAQITEHRYPDGVQLPTEADLAAAHGVSRHTVRRAFQDLVAEGAVYRIPGRGTFAYNDSGKYLRSSGSIEDLMALSLDTELEILDPPSVGVHIDAAGRLRQDTDEVVTMRFRRIHEDLPYCVVTAFLPVRLGRSLFDVPEFAQVGVRHTMTVLSVVQRLAGRPIAGADQSITAVPAPDDVSEAIDCAPGEPVLRIDRLYFDREKNLLELAINHFNPRRYTYRFQMRATSG
jgi:GntR family transcriptional regulator